MSVGLAVVVGSSRPGRRGGDVTAWVTRVASGAVDADLSVIDLAELSMPLFDESESPFAAGEHRCPVPAVQAWLDEVADVDGLLFVTAEYNHGSPAVLKNALDQLGREADLTPAAVVSYSETPRGGSLAAETLKLTLSKLGMIPLPHTLCVPDVDRVVGLRGMSPDPALASRYERALVRGCVELADVATALRDHPVTAAV